MDANKKAASRTKRSADEWQALITRFTASGMNLRAFCQVEKVSSSAFYRWRTLLGEGPTVQATHSAAAFVDLGALGAPQKSSSRFELSIDLGGGIVLTLVRN